MTIITGLSARNKKQDLIYDVTDFIGQKLGVYVSIDDCYKLGAVEPRPIVVSFQTFDEKRDVLHFKSHLKGDPATSKVFINDYVPTVVMERRKREKFIIQENEKLQDEDKLDIKYGKGGLLIQNETYRKKVRAPTPKDLVDLTSKQMTDLLKLKCVKGEQIIKEKSIFTGYTASVSSHKEIRNFYTKLKICEPNARHIVCAYRLKDGGAHFSNDFWDDEEPGAGRTILEAMTANEVDSRVIFVARKYGGTKLSGERFECYYMAAKRALEKDPMNDVNGRAQHLMERRPVKTVPTQESKKQDDSMAIKRPASSPQNRESGKKPFVRSYSKSYQRANQHQYRYRGRAGRQQRLNTVRYSTLDVGDERSYGRSYPNSYHRYEGEEYQRDSDVWDRDHDWSRADEGRF